MQDNGSSCEPDFLLSMKQKTPSQQVGAFLRQWNHTTPSLHPQSPPTKALKHFSIFPGGQGQLCLL